MDSLEANPNIEGETLFEASYQRLLPEFQALPPDKTLRLNLEVTPAVSKVLGVIAGLRNYRDEISRRLIDFDLVRFDKVEDYAKALGHANTVCVTAVRREDGLRALYDEGLRLRETLHSDVRALIARGLLDAGTIKNLSGPNGHKNVAVDLQILAQVAKDNFSEIEGNCAIQRSEIEHAQKLASRILRVVGGRAQNPARAAEAVDMRNRVFTLLLRAYEDARRAIIYLRWDDGDADTIAPSLYKGRNGGRKKAIVAEPVAPNAAPDNATNATVATLGPFMQ